jgi:large subunit ribosomal protein L1
VSSERWAVSWPERLNAEPEDGHGHDANRQAVKEIKQGKITYRVDKDGNLAMSIGRVSFDAKALEENISAVCDHLAKSRPATVKGVFIHSAVIHTTMGPSIKITFAGRN